MTQYFERLNLKYNDKLSCLQCFSEFGDYDGNVQIRQLINHSQAHDFDAMEFPKKCRAERCKSIEFLSLFEYVKHQIIYHAIKTEQMNRQRRKLEKQ